ncbi:MAG: RecX family transcriptional regulator [Prolixibacteraceae bacterium]|nr:RecX family transcriptional regulator [Prolixibacteraceae bacterium]
MDEKVKWAYDRCMAFCSQSEKCRSDVSKKLEKWGIEPAAAEQIIKQLIKERFIDEQRYANFFARDKFRFNKWGKVKIAYQLRQKNIPAALIEEALEQIDPEDSTALLVKLISDKARKITYKNTYDRKGKLMAYARSKGFEFDAIVKVIDGLDLGEQAE